MAKYTVRMTPGAQRIFAGLPPAAQRAARIAMADVAENPLKGTYNRARQSYSYSTHTVVLTYDVSDREALVSVIRILAI